MWLKAYHASLYFRALEEGFINNCQLDLWKEINLEAIRVFLALALSVENSLERYCPCAALSESRLDTLRHVCVSFTAVIH